MANNFSQAISKSTIQFNELCKPILKTMVDSDFMSIEGESSTEHEKMLDIRAGIDAWVINKNGIRGIASRIQNGKPYNTFTVRKCRDSGATTEYEKRKQSIKENYLYPYYTMQAYIDNDCVSSIAVCHTVSLYEIIEKGDCIVRHTRSDQIGGASFYIVDWDKFDAAHIRVHKK